MFLIFNHLYAEIDNLNEKRISGNFNTRKRFKTCVELVGLKRIEVMITYDRNIEVL